MNFHRARGQLVKAEVELAECQHADRGTTDEQHAGLDDLHPGGGDHATEGDIHHHQATDDEQRDVVIQTEEQLDQLTGTDHLRHQVEAHHGQRTDRGHGAHLALVEAVGGDVGEGELAQVTQALSHQEQDDRPADEEGQHVDVGIDTLHVQHRGQTEQRRRRHIVACDRKTVLEAGDASACGVEVGRRFRATGRPVGNTEGQQHEHEEHRDRVQVERLLLRRLHCGAGREDRGRNGEREQTDAYARQALGVHHFSAFHPALTISWLMSSNSPLARRT